MHEAAAVGAPPPPRISVIIPVRSDPARLQLCLQALAESEFRDFEVIVADDASPDHTADVAQSMGARVVRLRERVGSAAARNAAAEQARGDILLFVDADVLVHADTLGVAIASFDNPSVDAVFGSYDLEPGEPSLLSQYKNLAHRYFHQIAHDRATTFWTGCGAIRREVFLSFGGFNGRRFGRPTIEDIELGVRLSRAGRTIVVNRQMQAKHLKRWGLRSILRSDVFDRAIPWTRLILQMNDVPDDLNLATSQRTSALMSAAFLGIYMVACCFRPWLSIVPFAVFGAIVSADRWTAFRRVTLPLRLAAGSTILLALVIACWYARWWMAAMTLPLAGVILVNFRFYKFFVAHRGLLFAAAVLPMHVLYYLYSSAVFAIGTIVYRFSAAPAGDMPAHS